MDRADQGAQFPVPWDLFGLLGIPSEHRHGSHHHHSHRSMRMCEDDGMKDDRNGDGFDGNDRQLLETTCARTGEGRNNVRLHWCDQPVPFFD